MFKQRVILMLILMACLGWQTAHGGIKVRFVHAAPMAEARADTEISLFFNADFEVNGHPHYYQLDGVLYRHYTNFVQYPAVDFDIAIRRRIGHTYLVERALSMESGTYNWVILTGNGLDQEFDILHISSPHLGIESWDGSANFLHAAPSPGLAAVGLRHADGGLIDPGPGAGDPADLAYGEHAGFYPDEFEPNDFKVMDSTGMTNLLDPLPITFATTQPSLLLLIGDGERQPVRLLNVPQGVVPTAAPVDNSVQGVWNTANTASSEGVFVQPIPGQNRVVGTIFTYAEDESGLQRWYTFDSCQPNLETGEGCPNPAGFDGRRATAGVFSSEGGSLGGSQSSSLESAGTLDLEFHDCSTGTATLFLDNGNEVSWSLRRLVRSAPCSLED